MVLKNLSELQQLKELGLKKIITQKANLFTSVPSGTFGNRYDLRFYMTPTGERYVSPKELEDGTLPNAGAWKNALRKWDNAEELPLTQEEIQWAKKITIGIEINGFYFGWDEQSLRERKKIVRAKELNKTL